MRRSYPARGEIFATAIHGKGRGAQTIKDGGVKANGCRHDHADPPRPNAKDNDMPKKPDVILEKALQLFNEPGPAAPGRGTRPSQPPRRRRYNWHLHRNLLP